MSSLLFDKNTWLEIGLPTCYIKRVLIYLQNVPPKTAFQFQLLYRKRWSKFSWSLFLFLFFYFSFSTFKTLFLVLLKKRGAAYIFKGRAQMPKTMMQKCSRNCSCRLCSKMLHQWKGKNEHGRHPIASANEIANSDNTKILELFGATFGRHFSSRAPGYQRTCLGRHVFQTVRCWSQEAEDVAWQWEVPKNWFPSFQLESWKPKLKTRR